MPKSFHISQNELPLGASFFTVFLCILFGANAVAIKISLTGVGVFTAITIRFSIACVVLFLLAKWTKKTLNINKTQFVQMAIIAIVFFGQMSGFYHGLNKTTAAHGTLIANALPFLVMVLAHVLLPDDKITYKKVLGLILGFSGVVLLLFDKTKLHPETLQGDLIILVVMFLWAWNVIYIKRIIGAYNAIQITFFPMLLGLPLFFFGALFWDEKMVFQLSPEIITALLYQSLVTASFGFLMWNTMIKKYGATALHSFVFIMPISGVFFGVLLLGEPVTPWLIGSICLVTTGLIIVNYRTRKRPIQANEIKLKV